MRFLTVAVFLMVSAVLGRPALAQDQAPDQAPDQAWVQIEALPTLRDAEDRARAYATAFPEVAGFQLRSGWYAIVLGPFVPEAAAARLVGLRNENLIPADSYITDGRPFAQQFWPVGGAQAAPAEVLATPLADPAPVETAPLEPAPAETAPAEPAPEVIAEPEPDETPQQARRSEAELSADDRRALQTALAWYGHYTAAIDGAFGPGTRNSMAAWQEANGFESTGILTTRQRAILIANYGADQAEFGFETITEAEAGIEITLPLTLVQFDHYEPPFVHFTERGGSGLRVFLISQPGDQSSLFGLYDILQTLEVVPPSGERSRSEDSFTITASSASVQSYAQASLRNGTVKGFLVVWKPQDAERMTRILPAMMASFRAVGDRALDPGLVPMADEARRGLLAGLEVRRPRLSRTGFYIDNAGTVLTTAEAVDQCARITLDRDTDATLRLTDVAGGVAVLTPQAAMAPTAVASFLSASPRLGAEVAVSGYSYEDRLPAPVLTYGALEEASGLDGDPGLARLTLTALPGDAGGPVLDASGAVLGLLLPRATGGTRVLPSGTAFAATGTALTGLLAAQGIALTEAPAGAPALPPEDFSRRAAGMTVLVSCWD